MTRAVRSVIGLLISVAAIVVAVVTLREAGAAFGTMPDCGTGTDFLYPAPLMIRMVVTAACVSAVAAIVIVVAGPGWRWFLLAAFVLSTTAAAGTGAAWSEAAHGCDQEGHGYATFAAGATAVVGTLIAAVVGGAWAVRHPQRRPDGAPLASPPWSRALGAYRVRHSAVVGVTAGEIVWLALSGEQLLVLREEELAGRIGRDGLGVAGAERTITLTSDSWSLLTLEPLAGTDPADLLTVAAG